MVIFCFCFVLFFFLLDYSLSWTQGLPKATEERTKSRGFDNNVFSRGGESSPKRPCPPEVPVPFYSREAMLREVGVKWRIHRQVPSSARSSGNKWMCGDGRPVSTGWIRCRARCCAGAVRAQFQLAGQTAQYTRGCLYVSLCVVCVCVCMHVCMYRVITKSELPRLCSDCDWAHSLNWCKPGPQLSWRRIYDNNNNSLL